MMNIYYDICFCLFENNVDNYNNDVRKIRKFTKNLR